MSKSSLLSLQNAVKCASKDVAVEEKIASLTKAFDLFSHETSRLEKAYNELKNHLKNVNLELEQSNQKLNQKLLELDSVTNYLDSILSHISQGIIFIGISGIITTYNASAEKILGIRRKEALLSLFWDNFDDFLLGFSMKELLSNKIKPESFSTNIQSHHGLAKELEVTITHVRQGPEPNHGIILLLRDVTEIKRLQRLSRLNDRMKELGSMAASLAHEIRNPLGGIEGFASLLHRDLEGKQEQQHMASQIIIGTRELNNLVSRVLNYVRPVDISYEPVELVSFLKTIANFMEMDKSFKEKVQFTLKTRHRSLPALIDPSMFKSALLNLMFNAAQAMSNQGKVTLSLKKGKNHIRIEVSDTGVGIEKKNFDKIFSPFFTTKHNGNGFGLTEVYKVVQAHDSTIEVSSKINKGTIFIIKIPIISKKTERNL